MGSVLHGSARTTPRLRAELQASKESSRTLAASCALKELPAAFGKCTEINAFGLMS
jgi:hypothetical protein